MKKKFLLLLGMVALFGVFIEKESNSVSAAEMNVDVQNDEVNYEQAASTSMVYSFQKIYPKDGYMPQRIWHSRSGYSGYLYLERYEYTKNDNFLATYKGTLYKNVAPLKVVEVE